MIRPYHPEDYAFIMGWSKLRNIAIDKNLLPRTGFIDPEVAVGFLYQTDSHVCLIENYISNPDAPAILRGKVIGEITEALMQRAKDLGFKKIIVFTDNGTIAKFCDKFGFHTDDGRIYSCFEREI